MTTDKKILEQLKQTFRGKRRYTAKNDAYTFDIFDDKWQLGTKSYLHLAWMHDVGYDPQLFIDLRVLLAEAASYFSNSSAIVYERTLVSISNNLSPAAFKITWLQLSDCVKLQLACLLSFAIKRAGLTQFKEIAEFTKDNRPQTKKGNNTLDPEKGMYSEVEYQSIIEQLRLATNNKNKSCKGSHDVMGFCNLIACQLMIAIIRRPCQLVQLKWSDVLAVGQSFTDHRKSHAESVPEVEYFFSDIECLHVRTFRGKEGTFRTNAESRSHRLEPDFSLLLLAYRKEYELCLMSSLEAQEIPLTAEERREIMLRSPIFPEQQLFNMQFETKQNLFKALGSKSDALHNSAVNLRHNMVYFFKRLDTKSDRIDNDKLNLSNNRLRHTVLTQGASQGLSAPYLAAITGVTEKAIQPYIDLSVEARLAIDQAFADKDVLLKFGRISVSSLKKLDGFAVRNEFDEELGIQANPANCASCASKLGAPLGCYPCDNFTANEDADHQQYLDKAIEKYEVNKVEGNKLTLNKLRKIILYIRATIKICNERKLAEKGLCHD